MKPIAGILGVFFIIQGCATSHYMKMDAMEMEDQKIIFNDGKETITSQGKHFVSVAPYKELNPANERTSFVLFVQNLGNEDITISHENVSVKFEGNSEKFAEYQVDVQSYNELILEIEADEKRQKNAAMWAAIAGAIDAQDAATSTTTAYNSGTAYGTYNSNSYGTYANNPYTVNTRGNVSGSYSGITTSTTYDPAKAQVLANQNNQMFRNNLDNIASAAQSSRQLIEALVLKAQTIQPNQGHGGLIVTDTRDMNQKVEGNFYIVVSIDNEEHTFLINRSFYSTQ